MAHVAHSFVSMTATLIILQSASCLVTAHFTPSPAYKELAAPSPVQRTEPLPTSPSSPSVFAIASVLGVWGLIVAASINFYCIRHCENTNVEQCENADDSSTINTNDENHNSKGRGTSASIQLEAWLWQGCPIGHIALLRSYWTCLNLGVLQTETSFLTELTPSRERISSVIVANALLFQSHSYPPLSYVCIET